MQKKEIVTSSEEEYNRAIKVVSHLGLDDSKEFRNCYSSFYPKWPYKSYAVSVRGSFLEVQGAQQMKLIIHLYRVERESRPTIIVEYNHIDPLKNMLCPVTTVTATSCLLHKQNLCKNVSVPVAARSKE